MKTGARCHFTKSIKMLDFSLHGWSSTQKTCKNSIYSINIYKYIMRTKTEKSTVTKHIKSLLGVGFKTVQIDLILIFLGFINISKSS